MSIVSILLTLLILGLLTTFHETGHFLVAKLLGIKVEEFSIFVGPALFSWQRNGVQYRIRCIPFAAYVRYKGMEGEGDPDDPEMFFNHPRWKRLLTSLAGPAMNIILGVIIFLTVFSAFGFNSLRVAEPPEDSQMATWNLQEEVRVESGDRIIRMNGKRIFTDRDIQYVFMMTPDIDPIDVTLRSARTGEEYSIVLTPEVRVMYRLGISFRNSVATDGGFRVVAVEPESNGGNPVLLVGDIIFSVNGIDITDEDFSEKLSAYGDSPLTVSLDRDGERIELNMRATPYDVGNPRGVVLYTGSGVWETIEQSFAYPVSILRLTVMSLADIFSGRVAPTDALSGPLGMMTIVSDVVDAPEADNRMKFEQLGLLAGFFSVAVAFSNLLPIPGLDGNALILLIVEMIRGKKLSLKTESVINAVGFVCLILLVFFALFSDIFRLVN